MNLRSELDQLADTAERPTIDHTVWDRGRSLRRRDRLTNAAVVLALVVIVGGLASLVVGPPQAIGPADEPVPGGAVPARIFAVPASVTGPLEADLAIGRASVAFVSAGGLPVVIGAGDGRYHLLDLPGWRSTNAAVALSPDGRRLAWQTHIAVGASNAAIAVLDVESGRVTPFVVSPLADTILRTLAWSPDSRHLGAIGDRPTTPRTVVARVDVDAGRGQSVDPAGGRSSGSMAVASSGDLAISDGSDSLRILRRDGGRLRFPSRVMGDAGAGVFAPDGRSLALASGPTTSSKTLDLDAGVVAEHPFPADTFGASVIRPAGWLDDRLQLLVVQSTDDGDPELVVTTPTVDDASTWRRSVGSLEAGVSPAVTIAVDLIPDLDGTTSQRLTRDFAEPEWPGQRDVSWMIGLGVAAAVAVLLGLRWLWRRRTGLA